MEAITKTEQAFLKAVQRDARRKSLSYFFGILKNIQQEIDNEAYQNYCRQRYNHQHMIEEQRRQQQKDELDAPATIENIVEMAVRAVTQKLRSIKELAEKRAREWALELCASVRYIGPVRKKIQDAIGSLSDLDGRQKEQVWELLESFLNQQPGTESVTLVS